MKSDKGFFDFILSIFNSNYVYQLAVMKQVFKTGLFFTTLRKFIHNKLFCEIY